MARRNKDGSSVTDDFRLRTYRKNAVKIHAALDRLGPLRLKVTLMSNAAPTLLSSEQITALAVDIRHVWMDESPVNFHRVRSIVVRRNPDLRTAALALKQVWLDATRTRVVFRTPEHNLNTRDLFLAFMNGDIAHYDLERIQELEAVSYFRNEAMMGFQATCWRLATVVLQLDDLVAGVLGEDPLPT